MTRWIPLDRLRVIPAVIQSDSIVPAEYRAISDVGFNTILFVGRLSQEKRLELLLAAWQQVEAQLAGWQLKIVGDGPTRSQLEQIAAKLPRVEFVGWQQHPEQFFVSSQMFVLCSRYEGFPVALLEALYHGLPAIATNCSSAIDELNSQSNSGSTADLAVNSKSLEPIRKVSSESVDELAGAILELAHDSQRRQQMSQSAQRVAEHYTWQAIGPKWDRLLNT